MGMDIDTFVEPPEEVICEICHDVLEQAVTSCMAGHSFCKGCITIWKEKHPNCPSCRQPLQRNLIPNLCVRKLIDRIERKCPHSDCEWKGSSFALHKHKEMCLFEPVECYHIGCVFQGARHSIVTHQAKCPNQKSLEELTDLVQQTTNPMIVRKAAQAGCAIAQFKYGMTCKCSPTGNIWIERAARQGCVDAQLSLAQRYEEYKDTIQALYWLEQAAHVSPYAQRKIAQHWYSNNDSDKALQIMKQLSGQGDAEACWLLGQWLEDTDQDQAIKYYLCAANQGHTEALREMGTRYGEGDGIELDRTKEYEYLKLAADKDNLVAQRMLGILLVDASHPHFDEELGIKYLQKATDRGDLDAHFELAWVFWNDDSTFYDEPKTKRLFQFAADRGHIQSQLSLATLYDIEGDEPSCIFYLTMAADKGSIRAQQRLGIIFWKDSADPHVSQQDKDKSCSYLRMAADAGSKESQYQLALRFAAMSQNEMAIEYCTRAAAQGYMEAMKTLSEWYRIGTTVERNPSKSIEWYTKMVHDVNQCTQLRMSKNEESSIP